MALGRTSHNHPKSSFTQAASVAPLRSPRRRGRRGGPAGVREVDVETWGGTPGRLPGELPRYDRLGQHIRGTPFISH